MGFSLSCQSEVIDVIEKEAATVGTSKTQYINRLLRELFNMPYSLTSGTCLEELQAHSRLFGDDIMEKIPPLADKERRNPDQMMLYLIELGIGVIEDDSVEISS